MAIRSDDREGRRMLRATQAPSGPKSRAASDDQLMCAVQAGDTLAFALLYQRHCGLALRLARSVCRDTGRAEDAVQEAFAAAWRGSTSYRREAGSVQSWLIAIVRNRAVDSVRRETAPCRPRLPDADCIGLVSIAGSAHDEVIARCDADALRARLRRLPEAQAEVIALAYYGQLSQAEIARRLSLPPGTVKGRMRLGLDKLREQIRADG